MCIIIINDYKENKQKKQIDDEILLNSAVLNPDGLGVVWLDDFSIEYFKSEEFKVLKVDRPYIAHFRYATVGVVNKANMHPFQINEDEHLMQNGTLKGFGNKDVCDTKEMANFLSTMDKTVWKKVLELSDCRFTTVNTKEQSYQVYNKSMWIKKDGFMYSKRNVLDNEIVSVYGTLKYGYSNYKNYLQFSNYIGSGETKDQYPLIIEGLPYVYPKKGLGYNVDVDLFSVDKSTLKSLDQLEGHPNWYNRTKIPVVVGGFDFTVNAWLYFNDTVAYENVQHHKSYYQEPSRFNNFHNTFDDEYDYDYFSPVNECGLSNKGKKCPCCENETMYDDLVQMNYCIDCGDYIEYFVLDDSEDFKELFKDEF